MCSRGRWLRISSQSRHSERAVRTNRSATPFACGVRNGVRRMATKLHMEKGRTIMTLDVDEKQILGSVERGEWRPARARKRDQGRYSRYAKATFRKDRRLNIRISTKDLEAIQKRALEERLPYQTLIASLLHSTRPGGSGNGRRAN